VSRGRSDEKVSVMDVIEAIKTTGACRRFRPDPVPDDVLERLFDAARHGPQGGNRQPVRYIVVRDPELKKPMADWYLQHWNGVLEMVARGEYRAGSRVLSSATHMAEHFAEIPVLVVVCAVLGDLTRTDANRDRPGVVAGASIYPSVQNLMLAARNEGLGTTLTTLLCAFEPQVKELLGIPPELITAATIALGYPERPLPKKLSRAPVSSIVFSERYGQPLFGTDASATGG
jgi:nitroreductase